MVAVRKHVRAPVGKANGDHRTDGGIHGRIYKRHRGSRPTPPHKRHLQRQATNFPRSGFPPPLHRRRHTNEQTPPGIPSHPSPHHQATHAPNTPMYPTRLARQGESSQTGQNRVRYTRIHTQKATTSILIVLTTTQVTPPALTLDTVPFFFFKVQLDCHKNDKSTYLAH